SGGFGRACPVLPEKVSVRSTAWLLPAQAAARLTGRTPSFARRTPLVSCRPGDTCRAPSRRVRGPLRVARTAHHLADTAAAPHQFLVGADLDDPAPLEHDHPIGVPQRR